MRLSSYKLLDPEFREELERIVSLHEKRPSALLSALCAVQQKFGWISPALEEETARFLKIEAAQVHEAVTFYGLFGRRERGKYVIQFCGTLSCHLMGSRSILDVLQQRLGIRPGETTPDGRFTLETVECLGACDFAPVMQINGILYGKLTPEKIGMILERLV